MNEWENEPDELDWVDKETNFHCFMRRDSQGYWCGYVGILSTSPLYEEENIKADVHGGITWTGYFDDWITKDLWLIGFDCAHAGDYVPYSFNNHPYKGGPISYRNVEYVKKEVESLAKQLKKIERKNNEI